MAVMTFSHILIVIVTNSFVKRKHHKYLKLVTISHKKGVFSFMCEKNGVKLERFKRLVEESKKTRQMIAQDIGCDTSTVTKQYNGDMKISVDYLVKYARYFGVSADYLLGLSGAATADEGERYISEKTGLTVQSIKNLNECLSFPADFKDKEIVDNYIKNKVFWINQFINNPYTETFFLQLSEYLAFKTETENHNQEIPGYLLLNEKAEFSLFTAYKYLGKIADSVWLSKEYGSPNPILDIAKDVDEIYDMIDYLKERMDNGNH